MLKLLMCRLALIKEHKVLFLCGLIVVCYVPVENGRIMELSFKSMNNFPKF